MDSEQESIVENEKPKKESKSILFVLLKILCVAAILVVTLIVLFNIVLRIGFMFHTDNPQPRSSIGESYHVDG